jgi:putative ABC transport system substrate-binding protein
MVGNWRALIVVLAVLSLGAAVQAQGLAPMPRIGFLSYDVEPSPISTSFLQGLRDLGYVEGRDFVMEYRSARGHNDRLPALAAELVRARVDIIVTRGTAATVAARAATRTVPIVFGSAGSPVEKGIVASLARPGGNVTGLALPVGISKALELLKEAVPGTVRAVFIYDPSALTPNSYRETYLNTVQAQAAALNVKLRSVPLREPQGVPRVFAEIDRGTNGLVLLNAGLLILRQEQLCGLALQRRLAAVSTGRSFPAAGCLAAYGENVPEMYRRAATYVDRILKGARPSDLPVEQPTRFELVINQKTAKALGLTIPPSLLLRADQVLE